MRNLLRKTMLRIFSILTILLLYGFSAFAGITFTLCNGDGALDKKYYDDWKSICNVKPEKNYLACVRENAAETCDMPYQDMQGEVIGKKFILKKRDLSKPALGNWNVIKHKSSFALKLVAKPEPETDWGDYIFRETNSLNDGDIIVKNNIVTKCTVKEVC